MDLSLIGFLIGFLIVAGVGLNLTAWNGLTRAGRTALFIMAAVITLFMSAYTLTLTTSSPLVRWLLAFGSAGNPTSIFTRLLWTSFAVSLVWALARRVPLRKLMQAFVPFALVIAYPFLRYLISDAFYPTPEAMLDVLLLFALAGSIARTLSTVEAKTGTRRLQWALIALNGVTVLGVLATYYPIPQLRARLIAQNVTVDFVAVTLVGYEITPTSLTEPDSLQGSLYWRLNEPIDGDLAATVGVLPPFAEDTVARVDVLLRHRNLPTTGAWPTDITFRTPFETEIVPLSETPQGYRLTLAVRETDEGALTLPVFDGDRETLTPDTVALLTLPAVPSAPPLPDRARPFTFADGIALAGYTINVDGHTLDTAFWWEATTPIEGRYTQLLHVYPPDADQPYTFDAPPFGAALFTADWFPGMVAQDRRTLTLPDDAPSGEYEVFTGLYDSVTGARLPGADTDGLPLVDDRIPLGTVRVGE